ncbi:hypothetical protein AA309_24505 [Microvirga vignae]|uniref:DUF924 domain-containing protein n=1 Tax=Microvirga vignae TaxID=1225564 RepID=A0A0H1R6G6_9HYPH|nr:DUF924 family protein [Microvirga vignae]KLK90644.1 hypothetical protein AA309_24505 [Microvirga vignae]
MSSPVDWQAVYDFWFPASLANADAAAQWQRLEWWMRGGANPDLPRFVSTVQAAKAGQLDHWCETPCGRLSLIIVLDQFPRGLFAGTPDAFSSDPDTLRIAEEGFRNGHYEALTGLWERFFYFLPLAHAEGPDHLERMRRIVAISEQVVDQVPEHLKPIWEFSLKQARDNFDVISRFGRFPHRNPTLGRISTPEEEAYLAKGDFVHQRTLPAVARALGATG